MTLRGAGSRVRGFLGLPRYGPAAMHDPQKLAEVWFEGRGRPLDVTRNHVVAALRPFTVAVMFHKGSSPDDSVPARLCVRDRKSARTLGAIELHPAGAIELPEHRFCLFQTASCRNYSAPPIPLRWYYFRERIRAELRQRRNPFNFRMTTSDLRCSYVFYICPRPVFLVSVEHQGLSNMFPMDLVGPTDSPFFSMALRSTSPAVRLMQQSRRMALASVPFRHKSIVYALGKHHRLPTIDFAALPFRTAPSQAFRLPVMEDALRVREVQVREFHEVGSHVLFLTSVVSDSGPLCPDPQLFHAFSSYRESLRWT